MGGNLPGPKSRLRTTSVSGGAGPTANGLRLGYREREIAVALGEGDQYMQSLALNGKAARRVLAVGVVHHSGRTDQRAARSGAHALRRRSNGPLVTRV